MYLSMSDAKLTQLAGAEKGAIFVGTEMNRASCPSSYAVIDGGKEIQGELALGLLGNGAFIATRMSQLPDTFGIKLSSANLIELELGEPSISPFKGTFNVGQLLVTARGAYLGVDWLNGGMKHFGVVNLRSWTLENYADLNNSGTMRALASNWRLIHRRQDQTILVAESAKLPTTP